MQLQFLCIELYIDPRISCTLLAPHQKTIALDGLISQNILLYTTIIITNFTIRISVCKTTSPFPPLIHLPASLLSLYP